MSALRGLLLAVALGAAAWLGCSSGGPCQSTCTGCCDLHNECQPGTEANACGTNALQCERCAPGDCVDHACVAADGGTGGGGGGAASGGGSSTGGGSSVGGGSAGGGSSTGGGAATGGGSASGGGGGGVTIFDPDAGVVALSFGLCTPMNTCGGDPLGVWAYTSDCINDGDLQKMIESSALLCQPMFGGASVISNTRGWVQGWAGFDGSNARHVVHGQFAFTADLLGTCGTMCAGMPANLANVGLAASCDDDGGACICQIDGGIEVDQSSSYTFSGHTLTLGAAVHTFDFCTPPNKLLLHETTPNTLTEPGYPIAKKQ